MRKKSEQARTADFYGTRLCQLPQNGRKRVVGFGGSEYNEKRLCGMCALHRRQNFVRGRKTDNRRNKFGFSGRKIQNQRATVLRDFESSNAGHSAETTDGV